MKICRIVVDSRPRYAISENDGFRLFPMDWEPALDIEYDVGRLLAAAEIGGFLPPLNPSKIVCVGRNYAAHAKELNNPLPTEPLLFLKAPSAMISEGEAILLPSCSKQVEHEGELGIVIGRICHAIGSDEDPLEYVLGYVCVNDVTARDLQKKDVQFTRAKSFDTFCPVSRFIETEVDPLDLPLEVAVNGELRQLGRTSEMIFDIPFLIRYISDHMTLLPGDLIATGTPSGVSRLTGGDVCTVTIGSIGTLSNPVREPAT